MRIEEFFATMPFVTKRIMYITAALTMITTLGILHPHYLILNWTLVSQKFQMWRLITNVFYWGPVSINFVINFFIFLQYSSLMEKTNFSGNAADFIWCLFFGVLVMTIPGLMLKVPVLSGALMMYLIYIWCNKNPALHMGIMFIPYSIPAKWFPWALMGIRSLMGGSIADDLIGIVTGHLYHYLTNLLPEEQRISWLKTPGFLQRWFPVTNTRQFDGTGFTAFNTGSQQRRQQQTTRYGWGSGQRLGFRNE